MHESLIELGLTPENEANLRKLAEGLLARRFPGWFHMGFYMGCPHNDFFDLEDLRNEEAEDVCLWLGPADLHDCNSVGCALGWSPDIVTPALKGESYYGYGLRVFGMSQFNAEWHWCFHASWERADNTPEGAAKRILYMLDNGVPPDAQEQRLGRAPLCYV